MVISDHSAGWCHTCGDFVGEDLGRDDVGHRDVSAYEITIRRRNELVKILIHQTHPIHDSHLVDLLIL